MHIFSLEPKLPENPRPNHALTINELQNPCNGNHGHNRQREKIIEQETGKKHLQA